MSHSDRAFIRAYQEKSTGIAQPAEPQRSAESVPQAPRSIDGFDRPHAARTAAATQAQPTKAAKGKQPRTSVPAPHLLAMQQAAARLTAGSADEIRATAANTDAPGLDKPVQPEPQQPATVRPGAPLQPIPAPPPTNWQPEPAAKQTAEHPVAPAVPAENIPVGFGSGSSAARRGPGVRPSQRVQQQTPLTTGPVTGPAVPGPAYDPFQPYARPSEVAPVSLSTTAPEQPTQTQWSENNIAPAQQPATLDTPTEAPSATVANEHSVVDETPKHVQSDVIVEEDADASVAETELKVTPRLQDTLAVLDEVSADDVPGRTELVAEEGPAPSTERTLRIVEAEIKADSPTVESNSNDADAADTSGGQQKFHRIDSAHKTPENEPVDKTEVANNTEEPEVATLPLPPREFVAGWEVDRLQWPEIIYELRDVAAMEIADASQAIHQRAAIGQHVFAVAGAEEGVGCTTLVLALARQLAISGVKAVVVDANFDNPQVARRLRLGMEDGWEMSLLGEHSLADCSLVSIADELTVLPLSPKPGVNSTLANMSAASHLNELAEQFDVVLIDAGAGAENVAALTSTRDETLDAVTIVVHNGTDDSIQAAKETIQRLTGLGLQDILTAENDTVGVEEGSTEVWQTAT